MKLENQVCSLELAKKLKELGIEQKSLFYWVEDFIQKEVNRGFINISKNEYVLLQGSFMERVDLRNGKEYSAFTATELLEMLPKEISEENILYGITVYNGFDIWYIEYSNNARQMDASLCDALAKMLIHLKKII